MRAAVNDANDAPLAGGALLTGFGAPGFLGWDWRRTWPSRARRTGTSS